MAKPIFKDIRIRAISAIILAVLCLVPIYLGGYWFVGLSLIIGLRIVQEWVRMTDPDASWLAYAIPFLAVILIIFMTMRSHYGLALGVAAVFAIAAYIERFRRGGAAWAGIGMLYIAIPILAFMFVRGMAPGLTGQGLQKFLYVLGVVVAADVAAYLGGSKIRGPKIAPKLSPNKTWAGFISGLIAGCLAGAVYAMFTQITPSLGFFLAIPIVVFSVIGDFFESGIKRKFGVKDTGGILPGHGGVLDRIDALMLAMTAFAIALAVAPQIWPHIS